MKIRTACSAMATALIAVCAFFLMAQPAHAQTNRAYLGENADCNLDWDAGGQLADLMMTSRGWSPLNSASGNNVPSTTVDSNGWPMNDASITVFAGLNGEGMNGAYAVSFNGEATIGLSGMTATVSNQTYNSSSNLTTATVTLSGMVAGTDYSLVLNISNTQRTSTSATNTGVTRVKLMRPGYSNSTLFTTQALSEYSNFGAIRFMDWLATNGNANMNWSDRNTPFTYSQANSGTNGSGTSYGWEGRGTCYEYAVALCNATNCDMWVNVPNLATSAFTSELAQLILYGSNGLVPYTSVQSNPVWAPLNSNLHLYVEFSNEVWNYSGAFTQTPDVVNAGINFDTNGDPYHTSYDGTSASSAGYTIGMRYKAYLAMQMSSIFRSVFGNSAMMTRVRPVFETQKGGISPTLEDPLKYLEMVWDNGAGNYTSTPEPVSYYFWGGGGSGYVEEANSTLDTSTTLTVPQLFEQYFPSNWPGWYVDVSHEAGILAGYGLRREQYETGPGLDCANGDSCTVKQTGAYNDPRIGSVMENQVQQFVRSGGDMYMHFNAVDNVTHALLVDSFDGTSYKLQGEQAAAAATRPAVTYGVFVPGSIGAGSYEFCNDGYSGPVTGSSSAVTIGSSGTYYNYTINVTSSGAFTIGLTAASGSGSGVVTVMVDDVSLGTISVPGSATVTSGTLSVGLHSIRLSYSSGSCSIQTISASGGSGTVPSAPSGLTATAGNESVGLGWGSVSGATSYAVYKSTGSGGEGSVAVYTTTTNSLSDTFSLWAGNTYYYKVAAINAAGESGQSSEASAVPSTNPPSTPTGLSATGGSDQVSLSWTAVSGAAGYMVFRGTSSGGEGTLTVADGIPNNSYVDTNLASGTTYYYEVAALNEAGNSANSSQVSAVTTSGVPSAPTGLTATGGNAQVALAWNASGGATSYNVYRGTTSGGESGTAIATGITSASYTNTGLTNGTTYYYEVAALNSYGTSGKSNEASASPSAGTAATPTFSPAGGSYSSAQSVTLSDTTPGSTIYYTTNGSTPTTGSAVYSSAINVAVTQTIEAIAAATGYNNSAVGSATYTICGSAPPAPTGLTATSGAGQISLSWTGSGSATSYNVSRATVSGGESLMTTSIATTSYVDTSVNVGTTYYYKVSAVNSAGTSGQSNEASAAATGASLPIQINAAGPAVSPFVADTDYSGGTTATNWTGAIVTTGLTNPAPQAVYQSERFASPMMTYTIPGLAPSTTYTVRLHFCENYFTASGARVFDVSINGTQVLTSFDIYATTGAAHKATIQQFTEPANSSGQFVITFTNITNNALVDGIEIVSAGGSAPAAPTGLTATGGNAVVALNWSASSGASTYNVSRSTTSGSGYASAVSGQTNTYWTDTNVTNGVTYYYVVSAQNSAGTSGNSSQASTTPEGSTGETALSRTGWVASASSNATGDTPSLALDGSTTTWWDSGVDQVSGEWFELNMGSAQTFNQIVLGIPAAPENYYFPCFYSVYVSSNGTSWSSAIFSGTQCSPYATYMTFPTQTAQYVKIELTATGLFTGNSWIINEINLYTNVAAPAAPTGLSATAGNAQVVLSWSSSAGATSYNVYRGTTSGGESATAIATGVTITSYTNTGLTNGTTYYYKVAAVNTGGTSGYSNEASATPVSAGVLLASEPFAEATGPLNAANGGTGWSEAWQEQVGHTIIPGYDIINTSPLTFTGLATSGNYAVGGYQYENSGRGFDLTSGGNFGSNGYLSGGIIGASGKSLWMSLLMREDTSSADEIFAVLSDVGAPEAWDGGSAPLVSVGYFGTASETGSTEYWSLEIGSTVYKTSVPITAGTPALFVVEVTFGSTNTVNLYLNPTSLGGNAPSSTTLTETTSTSLAFQSFSYYAGSGPGMSSLDELRLGTTYGVVTP